MKRDPFEGYGKGLKVLYLALWTLAILLSAFGCQSNAEETSKEDRLVGVASISSNDQQASDVITAALEKNHIQVYMIGGTAIAVNVSASKAAAARNILQELPPFYRSKIQFAKK